MASSLRAATGELRTRTVASMSSQVGRYDRVMPVMERTPPDAPLLLVDLAALVRVEEVQGLLEARRVEQEHQVVVAAVADEFNHFGVILYGVDLCGNQPVSPVPCPWPC